MAEPRLALNDVPYVLTPLDKAGTLIRRADNPDTVNRFSQGQQTLADVEGFLPLRWPNLAEGLGRFRIDSDSAHILDEMRRYFDSTLDNRWADACGYLPILEEDSTHTGLEVIRGRALFKGDLWSTWEDDTSTDLVARKYTGSTTTWEGGGNVLADANTKVGLDLIAHKQYLLALFASTNDHLIYRSTDGVTWSAPTTQLTANYLSNNVTANEDIDAGLLTEIAGEAVASLWDEGSAIINLFTSSDSGDNWANETPTFASGNGPQGLAVMAGIDNEDKLYVGTREGLYEVDTAPVTWTSRFIFSMVPHNDNCRRMRVHSDGALWFAQGVDDDSSPIVYRMFVSNGQRVIEQVPNDFSLGDGLPAEALGSVRWMEPAQGMMYASAGGGKAGRNARIWCHNGRGWHSVRRHGTENEKIEILMASADDDGTPRLHYAVRTSSSVSNAKFLGQPFVNPRSGVSIKREASGYTDLPYVDGGFPLDTKTWMRVGINAEDLSAAATGEYIAVDYGVTADNAALVARTDDTTSLADFLSAVNRASFGTNAVGIAGLVLGIRVNLLRDATTNTDTPIWKDTQIDATVNLPKTDRYEFLVDLDKSAKLGATERRTTEVLADLNTARTSDVKVPIVYADLTTDYVKVLDVSYSERFESEGTQGSDANVQRRGTARVVVSEVL